VYFRVSHALNLNFLVQTPEKRLVYGQTPRKDGPEKPASLKGNCCVLPAKKLFSRFLPVGNNCSKRKKATICQVKPAFGFIRINQTILIQ
jgi:hypothetical protein